MLLFAPGAPVSSHQKWIEENKERRKKGMKIEIISLLQKSKKSSQPIFQFDIQLF